MRSERVDAAQSFFRSIGECCGRRYIESCFYNVMFAIVFHFSLYMVQIISYCFVLENGIF